MGCCEHYTGCLAYAVEILTGLLKALVAREEAEHLLDLTQAEAQALLNSSLISADLCGAYLMRTQRPSFRQIGSHGFVIWSATSLAGKLLEVVFRRRT